MVLSQGQRSLAAVLTFPILHTATTIQHVTHAEFRFQETLKFELAALTPAAWVEILSRRHSLWQQQQQLQPPHLAVPPAVLASCANQIAAAHIQSLSSVMVPPVRPGLLRLYYGYSCAKLLRRKHLPAPSHCFLRFARTSRVARHITLSCSLLLPLSRCLRCCCRMSSLCCGLCSQFVQFAGVGVVILNLAQLIPSETVFFIYVPKKTCRMTR